MDESLLANEELHLRALVGAARAEFDTVPAELSIASAAADASVLDAVILGPSKSGKSTLVNALLGQVLCPSSGVVNTLFPVAFSIASCIEGDARIELRLPRTLRCVLENAISNARTSGDKEFPTLPEDGIVTSTSDIEKKLAAFNSIGRAVADEIVTHLDEISEPIEVTRYIAGADGLQRRWRIIDFPGTSERADSATSRLVLHLLEQRLRCPSTGVLLCVLAKEQIGTEIAVQCFAPIVSCWQPKLWLVNKVDNESDHREVQSMSAEMLSLASNGSIFYVSATQLLAYSCAESLRSQTEDGMLLPPFEGPLYSTFPQEIDAIVRVLVLAASRESPHWKKQYKEARRSSMNRLCRATQFPIVDPNSSSDEEKDSLYPTSNVLPTSNNSQVRPAVWTQLSKMKLRIVMHHLKPLLRNSCAEVGLRLSSVVDRDGEACPEKLQESVARCQNMRQVLESTLASTVTQDKARLAKAIVDVAEQHIQRCVDELRTSGINQAEQITKLHSALEDADASLLQLQRDWIMQGDQSLGELCGQLDLVAPVALVAEIEQQSGVARIFESALFMVFSKMKSSDETDWIDGTGKFYMDGIRAAAPSTANRVVDTSRKKMVASLDRLNADLMRCQWDLAEVDKWATSQTRLRSLLASSLWLLKSAQVRLSEDDVAQLDDSQKESLASEDVALGSRSAVEALRANHPDWTWWMSTQHGFNATLFKHVQESLQPPASEIETRDAVRQLVFMHAVSKGIPQSGASEFLQSLLAPVLQSVRSATAADALPVPTQIAMHLWVSTSQLRGKELSSLVNAALRGDKHPALKPAVQIVLAMNALHLEKKWPAPSREWWPADGRVYRGGWIPDCHKNFFCEGAQYRPPVALSAYFDYALALSFAHRKSAPLDGKEPVIWIIRLDPIRRCAQAHLLELELVFVPYACFHVERARWQETPTPESPHVIEVFAYPDREVEASADVWAVAPWY